MPIRARYRRYELRGAEPLRVPRRSAKAAPMHVMRFRMPSFCVSAAMARSSSSASGNTARSRIVWSMARASVSVRVNVVPVLRASKWVLSMSARLRAPRSLILDSDSEVLLHGCQYQSRTVALGGADSGAKLV